MGHCDTAICFIKINLLASSIRSAATTPVRQVAEKTGKTATNPIAFFKKVQYLKYDYNGLMLLLHKIKA